MMLMHEQAPFGLELNGHNGHTTPNYLIRQRSPLRDIYGPHEDEAALNDADGPAKLNLAVPIWLLYAASTVTTPEKTSL